MELVALQDQTAEKVVNALETQWNYRYGVSNSILTDQSPNVDGKLVREMCEKYGITKKHSAAYHPQGDGLAERSIQSVKQSLRCLLTENDKQKTD